MSLNDSVKKSNSLALLKNVNRRVEGKKFHSHTHVLYDVRTVLGSEPKTYTEIGSYIGSSAALMLQHPYPTTTVCIDPLNLHRKHYGVAKSQYQVLRDNLNNTNTHNRSIQIHQKFSTDPALLQSLRDADFKTDILFIDGDHKRESVIFDFNNYHDFVSSGGYIVFDDYNDSKGCPQVHGAVNEIVRRIKSRELPYEIIGVLPNYQGALPKLTVDNQLNEFIIKKL